MKIWLDDLRPASDGWIHVHSPKEAIFYLCNYPIDEISLDHDLGEETEGNGNDVLLWIEEKTATDKNYIPPFINVHSMNISAQMKMKEGIKAIMRIVAQRKENDRA